MLVEVRRDDDAHSPRAARRSCANRRGVRLGCGRKELGQGASVVDHTASAARRWIDDPPRNSRGHRSPVLKQLRSEKPVPGRVTDTALWPRHRLGISDDSADRRAGARPRSRDPVNASSWKARGPKAIRHSDVLPAAPGRLCGRPWGSLKVSPPRPMRNRFGGNRTVANRPQEPCIRSRWFSIPCWPAGRSGVDPLGNEPIQSSRGASLSSSQLVQPPAFCR